MFLDPWSVAESSIFFFIFLAQTRLALYFARNVILEIKSIIISFLYLYHDDSLWTMSFSIVVRKDSHFL